MKNFFVFEGIDGSGKSTLVEELKKENNNNLFFTREPYGTNFQSYIKPLLELAVQNNEQIIQYLLFATERAHHISTVILPKLEEGKIVISDRFFDSSLVYQSQKVQTSFMKTVFQETNSGLTPKKTFFCLLEPTVAIERIKKRNKIDILDNYFLKKLPYLHQKYLELYTNRKDIIVLDMEKPIEENKQIILKECKQ